MAKATTLNENRLRYVLKDTVEQSLEKLKEFQRLDTIPPHLRTPLNDLCKSMKEFLKSVDEQQAAA